MEENLIEKLEEEQKNAEILKQEDEGLKEAKKRALLDCFVRSYHFKHFSVRVFSDHFAHKLISEKEYQEVSKDLVVQMYQLNPEFEGTEDEALEWMVEHKVAPAILGRNSFCEKKLVEFAENWGRQYFIFDSAYDTFGYRNYFPKLKVYEIDRAEMIEEKKQRLAQGRVKNIKVEFVPYDDQKQNWKEAILQTEYDLEKKVFCNLMGVSYRMSKEMFIDTLKQLSSIMCERSQIVLDYTMDPRVENFYSYGEIYNLLEENGFEILDYLDDIMVTKSYFQIYNAINAKHRMLSLNACSYCFAVKKSGSN